MDKKVMIYTSGGTGFNLYVGDVRVCLTDTELETLRDDIDNLAFEPEDRFKQMDEERTAMRLKIEELEEIIADLEEEREC